MRRSLCAIVVFTIITIAQSFCLYAETGTVQFNYTIMRAQEGVVSDIYFADLQGNRLAANSYYELDMLKSFEEPQFLLAVRNNLRSKDGNKRISLTFSPMTTSTDSNFKGGYVAAMYRYKDKVVDGVMWQDQSDLASNTTFKMPRDKVCVVENGKNGTFNWGLDKTDKGEEERVWYYAIAIMFDGIASTSPEPYTFLEDYDPGQSYVGTITVTLTQS